MNTQTQARIRNRSALIQRRIREAVETFLPNPDNERGFGLGFGLGFGRSSGYATTRHYVTGARPLFRCR